MNIETRAEASMSGEAILNDIHSFVGRFVAYPDEHSHVAHTLWIGHTHLMDVWDSTPRLAAISPEPECGKTRVLEISEVLVPRPVESVNVTPAYLFRKVADEAGRPTILYDEIDTVFGPKAKDNEEIRGLLNAGHRRHAMAGRCVVRGKIIETEEISAYCAVAMAGIGDLPDTIMGRSIILRMRRRAPSEYVEPWRRRMYYTEGNALRERLAAWADRVESDLMDYWPPMPDGVEDRSADVWEALLSVADKAGGDWPERARVACLAFVADMREGTPSLGIRLLKDLKAVFGDKDQMSSNDILHALYDIEEAPWADLRGRPMDARGLAYRLSGYKVKPQTVRIGDKTPKGYYAKDLWDSWERYLPAQNVADVADVADLRGGTHRDESVADSEDKHLHSLRKNNRVGSLSVPPAKSATSATSATNTTLQDFCTLVQHFGTSKHNTNLDAETIKAGLDQSDLDNLPHTTIPDRRAWAESLANRLSTPQGQIT